MGKTTKAKKQQLGGVRDSITLEDIINNYKILSIKLLNYSDVVAVNDDEGNRMAREQADLLREQQSLLCSALRLPTKNIGDVKSLLYLWSLEEVEFRNAANLTLSQQVAQKAYEYLDKNA